MSTQHVVVGAGPVGSAVARLLAEQGQQVRVVTRSGSGPKLPGVERVTADASDVERLAGLADGAAAVYNCANPPYHRWQEMWPPLAASLLTAAERSGAVLATMGNLYPYGPVDGPLTPDLPELAAFTNGRVRSAMWQQALAAHRTGRVRALEVRGSDYLGAGAQSHLGERAVPRLLAGKPVRVVGDPAAPHSWTWTEDAARTLVTAAATPAAWGRVWHVPSNPARSQRDAVADMARALGAPAVPVRGLPRPALRAIGLVQPQLRPVMDTWYQFAAPFVIDASATTRELGISASPWDEVLADHLAPFRTTASAAAGAAA